MTIMPRAHPIRWLVLGAGLLTAIIALFAILHTPNRDDGLIEALDQSAFGPTHLSTAPIIERAARSGTVKKVAFQRMLGEGSGRLPWLFVRDYPSGPETKVSQGSILDIAPTGDSILLSKGRDCGNEPWTSPKCILPSLVLSIDLRTKDVRQFAQLEDFYILHARYSGDASRIAFDFSRRDKEMAGVGILDIASGRWEEVKVRSDSPIGWASFDAWAPDDRSLWFHTNEDLYEVGLDGTVLRKISLSSFEGKTFSSETRFAISPDKRFLVFNAIEVNDPDVYVTLSILDLTTDRVTRLTPTEIGATEASWLPSGLEVLFTCSFTGKRENAVCKIRSDGRGLRTLIQNADVPSYSTGPP